jgi:predicted Zn-dependent peptidase
VAAPLIAECYASLECRVVDTRLMKRYGFFALEVLQAIMSRGESSRLYQSLVYRSQLASNAGFGANSMEEDGVISVTAVVAQGKAMADVEAALDAELARVRDAPVTAAELAEARMEIVAGEPLAELETRMHAAEHRLLIRALAGELRRLGFGSAPL